MPESDEEVALCPIHSLVAASSICKIGVEGDRNGR
jgi:hypothetical protein